MNGRGNAARGTILTVIWLITAAVALILTVVYFDKLQKLYTEADRQVLAREAEGDGGSSDADNNSLPNGNTGEADNNDIKVMNTEASGDLETGAAGSDAGSDISGEGTDNAPASADASDGEQGADTAQTETGAGTDAAQNQAGSGTDAAQNGTAGQADAGNGGNSDVADNRETADNTDATDAGEETKTPNPNYDYTLGIDPDKPIIALSFDDGPSIYTERIVAALQKNNVKATFFMVGYNITSFKKEVELVYNTGMEVANHTSDHKNLSELGVDSIRAQVFNNEDLINSIVPVGKMLVRPPYGAHNSTVRNVVKRPMINWSVDSLDWKTRNADSIVAQIQQDARDGYVVLMHDLYESTAEAAERIIPWLLENGYQITCISDMFKARGEKLEDGVVYRMAQPAQ